MSMVLPNTWRFRSGIPEKIELSTFQNGCFCPAEAAQGGAGALNTTWGATDKPTHTHFAQWEKKQLWVFEQPGEELWTISNNFEVFEQLLAEWQINKLGFWTAS